jgi:hypothetical protein
MAITLETIESIKVTDIEDMTLKYKIQIVKKINWGFGTRTARKALLTNAHITMIVEGLRSNTTILIYMNKATSAIIKHYINNRNASKEDLLSIEDSIKI